jgi:hypothetical protein
MLRTSCAPITATRPGGTSPTAAASTSSQDPDAPGGVPRPHPGVGLPRLWFLHQLAEAHFGLTSAGTTSSGTAFFAHIGGFVFGVMAAVMLARTGQRRDRRAERSRFGFGGRPVTQNM